MSYAAKDTRYDTMVYNRCGTGGLKLPAMSFGLWHNFGYGSTYSNAREMVLGAFDMGTVSYTHLNCGEKGAAEGDGRACAAKRGAVREV